MKSFLPIATFLGLYTILPTVAAFVWGWLANKSFEEFYGAAAQLFVFCYLLKNAVLKKGFKIEKDGIFWPAFVLFYLLSCCVLSLSDGFWD